MTPLKRLLNFSFGTSEAEQSVQKMARNMQPVDESALHLPRVFAHKVRNILEAEQSLNDSAMGRSSSDDWWARDRAGRSERKRESDRSVAHGLWLMENVLYYGDNLDILKRYVKDESVDPIYLAPPFKSDQNYSVLFKQQNATG